MEEKELIASDDEELEEIDGHRVVRRGPNILGSLDKDTRLVADKHCFMLQKEIKAKDGSMVWYSAYFYSSLGDALRGFIKHKARKAGLKVPNSKPMLDILDLIASLERTVLEVGDKLSKEWQSIVSDPIERVIIEKVKNGE